jgi:hypothetical protein
MARHERGDVHAPVEDTDVSFGLKVLVLLMILILLGVIIAVVASISQASV